MESARSQTVTFGRTNGAECGAVALAVRRTAFTHDKAAVGFSRIALPSRISALELLRKAESHCKVRQSSDDGMAENHHHC